MLPTKIRSEKHEQYFAPLRETMKKYSRKQLAGRDVRLVRPPSSGNTKSKQ